MVWIRNGEYHAQCCVLEEDKFGSVMHGLGCFFVGMSVWGIDNAIGYCDQVLAQELVSFKIADGSCQIVQDDNATRQS